MKYLSDYANEKVNKVLDEYGAFFAFSNDQFDEKADPDVVYVRIGSSGLIGPKDRASEVVEKLDEAYAAAREEDLAENGVDGVVLRELNNHECFYTGDPEPAVDACTPYGISKETVIARFHRE